MLIAFWSILKGQAGVTSNMIILSLLAAIQKKMRVMVCSSLLSDFSLERALLANLNDYTGETLNNYGFEPMMRYAKNGLLCLENFSDFALPLVRGLHYDLIMGTKNLNFGEIERTKNEELMLQILDLSKKKYDMSFVDLENGTEGGLSEKIMSIADLIVFNTNQNCLSLEALLSSHSLATHRSKATFLIGRYEDGIVMNRRNIEKKYGLKPLNIIPRMPQLIDLLNRGEIIEFIGRAANSKAYMKKDFFQEGLKAVERLTHFTKGD